MATNALELIGPVRRGRPSKYSDELAMLICRRIAEGETLTSICLDEDMPARSTVCDWLMRDLNGFSGLYARAREFQGDYEFDEIRDIADDPSGDAYIEMTDSGPKIVLDGDNVRRAQLKIEARKWRAERLNRKAYGAKVEHEIHNHNAPPLGAERVPEGLEWLTGQLPSDEAAERSGPDHSDVGEE